jgi:hypothetical protein
MKFIIYSIFSPIFSADFLKNKTELLKEYFFNKIKLGDNNIPSQSIKIIEFNKDYVIIKATKLLGIKHCFFKAVEFFNSKYKTFFLKIDTIQEIEEFIIVKFIAYNITYD